MLNFRIYITRIPLPVVPLTTAVLTFPGRFSGGCKMQMRGKATEVNCRLGDQGKKNPYTNTRKQYREREKLKIVGQVHTIHISRLMRKSSINLKLHLRGLEDKGDISVKSLKIIWSLMAKRNIKLTF